MGVKVFTHEIIEESMPELDLQALVVKFKQYKEDQHNPAPLDFGRDVPYHRPSSAAEEELMHLHMRGNLNWSLRTVQFKRTSDTHLVYCPGWTYPDHYLLIAIITDAHRKANNVLFMSNLADIAREFRYEN
ncbi:type II toxin-antitoxin system YafO family toxin [Microbulbifer sp. VAAC004]|uniref:type II toxin-antitoxin system YafO family toxin n=1 Tax=unclassified Microbulbifer TaxID=2619833 RepID=UPI00403A374B